MLLLKQKQSNAARCVCAERKQLLKMCWIENAIGHLILALLTFHSACVHDFMISEWKSLSTWRRQCYAQMRTVLPDNQESHCILETINNCHKNRILVVTFPAHCTHRMQLYSMVMTVSSENYLRPKMWASWQNYNYTRLSRTRMVADIATPDIYLFSRIGVSDDDVEYANELIALHYTNPG